MSEIYYALIIFPLLFITAMSFIYASSLNTVNVQLLRMNCPYPIMNVNITNVNIDGVQVTYNSSEFNGQSASKVTVFRCGYNDAMTVSTSVYTFSSGIFDAQQAWLGYVANSMTEFFDKVIAFGALIPAVINAPAEVLSIPEYTYINTLLIIFIALGVFMVVRG